MIDKTKLKSASEIVNEEAEVKPTIRLASMAQPEGVDGDEFTSCLLYTSDAADD